MCLAVSVPLAARAEPAPLLVLYPVISAEKVVQSASGRYLKLEDLGRIIVDDGYDVELLAAIRIKVGEGGKQESLEKKAITAQLARMPALSAAQIVGPDLVRFSTPPSDSRVTSMLEQAEKYIQAQSMSGSGLTFRNLEINYIGPRDRLDVSEDSKWSFSLDAGAGISRRTLLWVDLSGNGTTKRQALWFGVSGEVLVWRVAERMEAKTPLREQGVYQEWLALNLLRAVPVAAIPNDMRFVSAVEPGAVLTRAMVEFTPAVEFGQETRVIVQSGPVRITTSAIALQTANVGERIALKSVSSDEQFEALVIAPYTVQAGLLSENRDGAFP